MYDKNNKILLQYRTDDAPILPNYWGFFGGTIENNETPENTLTREIQEELDYKLRNPKFLLDKDFIINGVKGHMYVFTDLFLDNKSILSLNEGKDWGWFGRNEIDKLKLTDYDKKTIKTFFNGLK